MKLVDFLLGGWIKVFGIEVPRLFVFFLIMIPICAYIDYIMFNDFDFFRYILICVRECFFVFFGFMIASLLFFSKNEDQNKM